MFIFICSLKILKDKTITLSEERQCMAFQPGVLGRGWDRGWHVGGTVGGHVGGTVGGT